MGLCEAQQRALVVVFTLRVRGECWNQPSWVAGTAVAASLGGGAKQPHSQQSKTFPGTRIACSAHILIDGSHWS